MCPSAVAEKVKLWANGGSAVSFQVSVAGWYASPMPGR
jgi:hypothetical protein